MYFNKFYSKNWIISNACINLFVKKIESHTLCLDLKKCAIRFKINISVDKKLYNQFCFESIKNLKNIK